MTVQVTRPIQFRSDLLTDLLLEALQKETGCNRTIVIKTAIQSAAEEIFTDEEMKEIYKKVHELTTPPLSRSM